ncbi:MAG: hypothetical protein J0G32_04950 [Alphaproteobacteria bacterium]|nr:hypothetical protein [Alphaproteobacteria bacterium]OJV15790.1 MAG: hypothetical protein BGO27_07745 [Alphaproteobacteria bacterium 33-17]
MVWGLFGGNWGKNNQNLNDPKKRSEENHQGASPKFDNYMHMLFNLYARHKTDHKPKLEQFYEPVVPRFNPEMFNTSMNPFGLDKPNKGFGSFDDRPKFPDIKSLPPMDPDFDLGHLADIFKDLPSFDDKSSKIGKPEEKIKPTKRANNKMNEIGKKLNSMDNNLDEIGSIKPKSTPKNKPRRNKKQKDAGHD